MRKQEYISHYIAIGKQFAYDGLNIDSYKPDELFPIEEQLKAFLIGWNEVTHKLDVNKRRDEYNNRNEVVNMHR